MIKALTIWDSAKLILRENDNVRFTVDRFCDALNDGMSDLTNELDFFIDSLYMRVPPLYNSISLADRAIKIVRVEYSDPQRSNTYRLEPVGVERLDAENRGWRFENFESQPRYYVVNRQNVCEFFVYPLARREDAPTGKFGILAVNDSQLNPTNDFGVITGLDVPYLQVFFSERQKRVVPNEDKTDIIFEGTTDIARFAIQEDVMHCLKHYCTSVMLSDDNEQFQSELSKTQFALYTRKLDQLKGKKSEGYTSDIIRGFYNTGFDSSHSGRYHNGDCGYGS